MHAADLIVTNIRELATCASQAGGALRGAAMSDAGLLRNAAVAIVDGKFAAAAEAEEIVSKYSADKVVDAGERAVVPGFVDPHTHIVFGGDRLDEFELKIRGADYLEILAAGGGILSTVARTRAASEDELVDAARARLDRMLACGTTTAEIKTGYGLDLETELKMLRVVERLDREHPIDLVPTFLPAHAVPPEFKGQAGAYVDLICREMLPAAREWYEASHFARQQTPFFVDVFTEKNAFDLDQTRTIFETARELDFALKAHVDEFSNLGGSRLAIEYGAVSIDHLDAISDVEMEMLAASRTTGVVTPTVNFNFGSGDFADARRLIDAGCAVALSTDYNPGSAPCPSQPMAMAIACRYQRLLPAEALTAATINAAHAIGLGERLGSIEPGKRADLVILDRPDHREAAYEFGVSPAATVIKSGKIVFRKQ
ncbi:MAG: imidazolonepropionase [Pyrinomonadaceae bacterium]